jgi:hypothetical protein
MNGIRIGLACLAILLLALVAGQLWAPANPARDQTSEYALPWQVEVLPGGGSKVFGLQLGSSRLADARARLGPDLQMAVIMTANGPPALEAYYERIAFGFITGRLILTAELPSEELAVMARRAAKVAPLQSGAWQATLAADDRDNVLRAPVTAIAFIPSVDLDEATVVQRFGPPAERLPGSGSAMHYLYPTIGLDLVLDDKGKELLQYVAPKDFARLRDPLLKSKS